MKKSILFFLTILLVFSSFNHRHPYHVGSVNIDYNSTSKTFEITGSFFMDDLENSINKTRKSKVFFHHKNQEKIMHDVLEKWTQVNMKMKVNGQRLPLEFIGYEEDKESVRVYLESTPISSPKVLELGISALYNLFDDQLNIIHISINGKRKSNKLRYPEKYLKLIW